MNITAPSVPHIPLPRFDEKLLHLTDGSEMQWSDSRRFPRKKTNGHCTIIPDSTYANCGYTSATQEGILRNLSRGGVRILHGGELFPGETLELLLQSGTRLRLMVVWCRRQEPGFYVSGCHFSESL